MKILAFCDTHSDVKAIEALAKKAEGCDAIICAGDISEFGDNIGKLFKILDIGIPLLYIPGNHELEIDVSDYKFVKNIHKKALLVKDVLFMGCGGGGFSKYYTLFEMLIPVFRDAMNKHKRKSVLVTHAPPLKTKLDEVGLMDVGVDSIRLFIEKEHPDIAICGHIHENAGKKDKIGGTIIVNPGKKGMILEI